MKQTELIMGMPITIEIVDSSDHDLLQSMFDYFRAVDDRYSPYKPDSELTKINEGLARNKLSSEMTMILDLCEQTRQDTNGYFNIRHDGKLDPSGLVKGWAVNQVADKLLQAGHDNFYVEAGGDIQAHGHAADGGPWRVGIRSPFNMQTIVKTLAIQDGGGVATSGTYIRGQHIYNPVEESTSASIQSLTVIGPNIYDADRFATAAFAMGSGGIAFIQALPGLEAYMITDDKQAVYTPGLEQYVVSA